MKRISRLFLICSVISLCSCGSLRTSLDSYSIFKIEYNEGTALAVVPSHLKKVHQSEPDICWAACMEQALAHQGVTTTQEEILKKVFYGQDKVDEKSLSSYEIDFDAKLLEFEMPGGDSVWMRCDVDGDILNGVVLLEETMHKKLSYEFSNKRISMIGIKNNKGVAHAVNVVGAIYPEGNLEYDRKSIIGYVIFDPETTGFTFYSIESLFKITKNYFYITTYTGMWSAGLSEISAKYLFPWSSL